MRCSARTAPSRRPGGSRSRARVHTVGVEIAAAGAVVFDQAGRLLLIQRAKPPEAGRWSLPGGKCRPGEAPGRACVREVAEETGLQVHVLRTLGRVVRPAPGGARLLIDDFLCEVTPGSAPLAAADDASAAAWFSPAELDELPTTSGLLETLRSWGVLPPPAAGR